MREESREYGVELELIQFFSMGCTPETVPLLPTPLLIVDGPLSSGQESQAPSRGTTNHSLISVTLNLQVTKDFVCIAKDLLHITNENPLQS